MTGNNDNDYLMGCMTEQFETDAVQSWSDMDPGEKSRHIHMRHSDLYSDGMDRANLALLHSRAHIRPRGHYHCMPESQRQAAWNASLYNPDFSPDPEAVYETEPTA